MNGFKKNTSPIKTHRACDWKGNIYSSAWEIVNGGEWERSQQLAHDISLYRQQMCSLGLEESFIDSQTYQLVQNIAYAWDDLCESVIEEKLLSAMTVMYSSDFLSYPPKIHNMEKETSFPVGDLIIVPQFKIARYRLDFLIVAVDTKDNKHLLAYRS